MRYIVTFLVGISLSFAVNAATLQEQCSWGANFVEDVAVARLKGHSKEQVLKDVARRVDTAEQFTNLKSVVEMVYGLDYNQLKEHEAVRALFYQACMERNSTQS